MDISDEHLNTWDNIQYMQLVIMLIAMYAMYSMSFKY